MEKIIKDLWLTKVKKGIVAVVESPYAPNNHNCIWLNNGVLKAYTNSGWEEFGETSGSGTGGSSLFGNITLPIKFDVEITGMDEGGGGGGGTRDVPNAKFTANPKGAYLLPYYVVNNGNNVKLCPYIVIRQKYVYQWDDGGGEVIKDPIDNPGLAKSEEKTISKKEIKLPVDGVKASNEPFYVFFIKRLLQYSESGAGPDVELYLPTMNSPYFSSMSNSLIEDVPSGDEPGWTTDDYIQIRTAALDKATAIKEMTEQGISQENIDSYINNTTETYGLGPDGTINQISFNVDPYVFEIMGNYGTEGDPEAMLVWGDEQSYSSGENLRGIPESWATYMEETPNCVVSYYAQNI